MKYLCVAFIAVASILMLQEADVQAAAKWKEAYENKVEDAFAGMYCEYAFVKMNGSKTPILMVRQNYSRPLYGVSLDSSKLYFYRYKNGKVKQIGKCIVDGQEDLTFKSNGKKIVITSEEETIYYEYYVIKMKNGKMKKATYRQEWYGEGAVRYLKGTKEINEKSYKKAIKANKEIEMYEHFAGNLG